MNITYVTGGDVERVLDALLHAQNRFQRLDARRRVVISQLPLNVTLLLVAVVVLFTDRPAMERPGFVAGQAVALLILGLCLLVPWNRLPGWSILLVPVMDFIPLALVRSGIEGVLSGLGLLAVFPVMWLAGSGYRPRLAVAVSTLGSLLMVWTPLLAVGSTAPHNLVAEIVVPFMLLAVAIAMSVLTVSGMTQQRRVEELLAQSKTRERLLDTILDTVDVGVLVVDSSGKDVFMNAKQRQLFLAGLPDEASGADDSEVLLYRDGSDELLPLEQRPVARALAGDPISHELYRLGRGTDARMVSVSAREFLDAAGDRGGMVLACSDVTEVVVAVRARDSFLSAMSHEFRTPLTSLLGYAELLQDDTSLGPSARADLQVMSRNARHLRKMVDDILAASVEGSSVETQRTRLDLARLLRQAAASAMPEAEGRGIELRVVADDDLPVLGDRTGLVRILDNLVSNALKYSDTGTSVLMTAERDGRSAVCRIEDQGLGIAPEDLGRIFTRFQRTDAARRAGIPGTGLGLALAQEVAEQHGGRLEVASEVGVGSVFTLRIPLTE
ncbi:sensor histidine kinase [Sinomonas sp.]|uniref:sensor histidine kinase n=1 Tax=Sinomonas sp. TaxID=1914986 RepID=UPI002CDA7E70|nr:ATP-binding protein [Sinomonas sp.]